MNNRLIFGTLKHFLLVLSISTAFVVINGFFLNIPIVQTIIRDILGHTLTLSNRILIYQQLGEILNGHWLIGFGFGTSYELGMSLGKFPIPKKALWNGYGNGSVGTVLLFCVIVSAMRELSRKKAYMLYLRFCNASISRVCRNHADTLL